MAKTLRMPSETELPPGPLRDFVELLWYFFRLAMRPTLREISLQIKGDTDLRGTASTETIRRMLRGATVPAHWETVEAVAAALGQMARINLDGEWEWDGVEGSPRKQVERLCTGHWTNRTSFTAAQATLGTTIRRSNCFVVMLAKEAAGRPPRGSAKTADSCASR